MNYLTWELVGHLKDIATIVTPVLLAILGLLINVSMQRQNRIAERNSAFVKQWADNFAELALSIDASVRKLLLLYFKMANAESFIPENSEGFKQALNEVREIALLFDEYHLELEKYVDLAPRNSPTMDMAFRELLKYAAA